MDRPGRRSHETVLRIPDRRGPDGREDRTSRVCLRLDRHLEGKSSASILVPSVARAVTRDSIPESCRCQKRGLAPDRHIGTRWHLALAEAGSSKIRNTRTRARPPCGNVTPPLVVRGLYSKDHQASQGKVTLTGLSLSWDCPVFGFILTETCRWNFKRTSAADPRLRFSPCPLRACFLLPPPGSPLPLEDRIRWLDGWQGSGLAAAG